MKKLILIFMIFFAAGISAFAGYLTDGTEYRTKPWTSKAE